MEYQPNPRGAYPAVIGHLAAYWDSSTKNDSMVARGRTAVHDVQRHELMAGEVETIRGATVTLRPASESDLDLLAGWFSDPQIYEWWGGSPLRREVVAEKYTGRRRPAVESLIIEAEGEPVGYIQYHQRFHEYHHEGEGGLDMCIAPNAQRQGFGRDAAVTLVRHLLTERGWSRVTVDPAKNNPRALRFWRECGFRYERDIESSGPAELLSVVR